VKSIFIAPPSFDTLKKRILERNENTPDEIAHRLKAAQDELDQAQKYDHIVVNDDIDACVERIAKIIEKGKN